MYDRPIPADLGSIEDWILQYIYYHPKDKHSTISLLPQLDQVLRDEPSRLEECNDIRRMMRAAALSAEEYAANRKPERSAVQRAVETLIREGWANGEPNSDGEGVFFEGLKLTRKGTREALNRAHQREVRKTPPRSSESTIREARKRAGLDEGED
jgi:hypothetical protein